VDAVVCITGQVIVMQNYGGQRNEVLLLRSVTMLSGTSQTVMETFVAFILSMEHHYSTTSSWVSCFSIYSCFESCT
jgi:hypothetical protein